MHFNENPGLLPNACSRKCEQDRHKQGSNWCYTHLHPPERDGFVQTNLDGHLKLGLRAGPTGNREQAAEVRPTNEDKVPQGMDNEPHIRAQATHG
jgi:hypothetical protein